MSKQPKRRERSTREGSENNQESQAYTEADVSDTLPHPYDGMGMGGHPGRKLQPGAERYIKMSNRRRDKRLKLPTEVEKELVATNAKDKAKVDEEKTAIAKAENVSEKEKAQARIQFYTQIEHEAMLKEDEVANKNAADKALENRELNQHNHDKLFERPTDTSMSETKVSIEVQNGRPERAPCPDPSNVRAYRHWMAANPRIEAEPVTDSEEEPI